MVLRINFIIRLKLLEMPAENNYIPKMMNQIQRTTNMKCNVQAKGWHTMIAKEMHTL